MRVQHVLGGGLPEFSVRALEQRIDGRCLQIDTPCGHAPDSPADRMLNFSGGGLTYFGVYFENIYQELVEFANFVANLR